MRHDIGKLTIQDYMKTPSNNDDYKIVITKPSKFKRSNEWIESSGELSHEENHYLDTHENSISGEIRNFTLDDLKSFE